MEISSHLWRLYYRAWRFADVPAIVEHLKFRDLRRKYYDKLWQEAAAEIGAKAERGQFGYVKISKGEQCTFVRQDRVMLDSHLMLNLMGNKAFTYDILRQKGCPIPAHLLFDLKQLGAANEFMAKLNRPVVVKPVAGTGGGHGVTTGIRDPAGLKTAAKYASRFDSDLLIEEEIEGHSYRLLYLNGELLHGVRRDPPMLTGDGKSSLKALAQAETKRRLQGSPITALSPLRLDKEAANTLALQNLKASHVLEAGRSLAVKKAVNQNTANRNHTVTAEVHPETARACAQLVRDLGVSFAGIDIISKDIAVRFSDNGGLIGEINTTPGIHHHYLVAEPQDGIGVAGRILNYMFESGTGTMRLAANFPIKAANESKHAA